jgi:plastocyanin
LRRSTVLPAALMALVGLTLGACGSSGTKTSSAVPGAGTPAGGHLVTIKGYAYEPAKLTIKAGTAVDVANKDSEPHTLTADDKSFDTGNIEKGKSKALTLGAPGTYHYYCTLHPYMKGTITVQ